MKQNVHDTVRDSETDCLQWMPYDLCCLSVISDVKQRRIIDFETEERKRRRREERKRRKWKAAGIEPTAAAPSQPAFLDVSRSDHSIGKNRLRLD